MKTIDEIYAGMCSVYREKTGRDIYSGGDMSVRLYAMAAELNALYLYNDWVKRQCFPQTAEGEYLDNHAEMRAIKRNGAVAAKGYVRFSVPSPTISELTVNAGTVCMTAEGVQFETVEAGVIEIGESYCDVPVRALTAGSAGNVPAGSVVYMANAPVGVSYCENMDAISGGEDIESDEKLRARVLASFNKLPNGANIAYYEKEALSIDGVTAVRVLLKERGIGTVDVVVSSADGLVGAALIAAVKQKLDAAREICVDIAVRAPENVEFAVSVAVDIAEGYSFAAVKAEIERSLFGCFDGGKLGESVLLAELGSLLFAVEGVRNYRILSPTADITLAADELPKLSGIHVSEWS